MSEEICLFVLSPQTEAKGPFGETDFRGDMTDGWEVGLGVGVTMAVVLVVVAVLFVLLWRRRLLPVCPCE